MYSGRLMCQKLALVYSYFGAGLGSEGLYLNGNGLEAAKNCCLFLVLHPHLLGFPRTTTWVKSALPTDSTNRISRFIKFHKGGKNPNIPMYLEDVLVRRTLCISRVLLDLSVLARLSLTSGPCRM